MVATRVLQMVGRWETGEAFVMLRNQHQRIQKKLNQMNEQQRPSSSSSSVPLKSTRSRSQSSVGLSTSASSSGSVNSRQIPSYTSKYATSRGDALSPQNTSSIIVSPVIPSPYTAAAGNARAKNASGSNNLAVERPVESAVETGKKHGLFYKRDLEWILLFVECLTRLINCERQFYGLHQIQHLMNKYNECMGRFSELCAALDLSISATSDFFDLMELHPFYFEDVLPLPLNSTLSEQDNFKSSTSSGEALIASPSSPFIFASSPATSLSSSSSSSSAPLSPSPTPVSGSWASFDKMWEVEKKKSADSIQREIVALSVHIFMSMQARFLQSTVLISIQTVSVDRGSAVEMNQHTSKPLDETVAAPTSTRSSSKNVFGAILFKDFRPEIIRLLDQLSRWQAPTCLQQIKQNQQNELYLFTHYLMARHALSHHQLTAGCLSLYQSRYILHVQWPNQIRSASKDNGLNPLEAIPLFEWMQRLTRSLTNKLTIYSGDTLRDQSESFDKLMSPAHSSSSSSASASSSRPKSLAVTQSSSSSSNSNRAVSITHQLQAEGLTGPLSPHVSPPESPLQFHLGPGSASQGSWRLASQQKVFVSPQKREQMANSTSTNNPILDQKTEQKKSLISRFVSGGNSSSSSSGNHASSPRGSPVLSPSPSRTASSSSSSSSGSKQQPSSPLTTKTPRPSARFDAFSTDFRKILIDFYLSTGAEGLALFVDATSTNKKETDEKEKENVEMNWMNVSEEMERPGGYSTPLQQDKSEPLQGLSGWPMAYALPNNNAMKEHCPNAVSIMMQMEEDLENHKAVYHWEKRSNIVYLLCRVDDPFVTLLLIFHRKSGSESQGSSSSSSLAPASLEQKGLSAKEKFLLEEIKYLCLLLRATPQPPKRTLLPTLSDSLPSSVSQMRQSPNTTTPKTSSSQSQSSKGKNPASSFSMSSLFDYYDSMWNQNDQQFKDFDLNDPNTLQNAIGFGSIPPQPVPSTHSERYIPVSHSTLSSSSIGASDQRGPSANLPPKKFSLSRLLFG